MNPALVSDYSSTSRLYECGRKFQHSIVERLTLPEPNVPLYAGQVMAEGLLHLHTVQKERWKRGAAEHDAVHQAVTDILETAWGTFQTPPSAKHHYLTLGHLETVMWYYVSQRDPSQVEPLEESGRVLAEKATTFDWPVVRNGQIEMLRLGGKPDIPALVCGSTAIVDWKCTTQYVTNYWAKKFSIGHQLRTYMAMLRHAYGIEVTTAYVDGVHMGAKASASDAEWKKLTSVRSKLFGPYHFDEKQLQETWDWYRTAEELKQKYAELNYYPQNENACSGFGGCMFQGLCAKSPRSRKAAKMQDFMIAPERSGMLLSGADSDG